MGHVSKLNSILISVAKHKHFLKKIPKIRLGHLAM